MQIDFVWIVPVCFQRGHHFLPSTQVGKGFRNNLATSLDILLSRFLWFLYAVAYLSSYYKKATNAL